MSATTLFELIWDSVLSLIPRLMNILGTYVSNLLKERGKFIQAQG